MVYTLRFFLLQNVVCFIILTYLVPVLFTFYIQDVLKLKNNSGAKRLIFNPCAVYEVSSANHYFFFRHSAFQFVQTKGRNNIHTRAHTHKTSVPQNLPVQFCLSGLPTEKESEMAQLAEHVPIPFPCLRRLRSNRCRLYFN